MKKVMYVMSVSDEAQLDTFRNYKKISENPEDRDRCIYRERWQEIDYFSKTGNCLFYDGGRLRTPDFAPYELQPNDLLCPRMGVPQALQFIRTYPCISTPESYNAVEFWFRTVPKKYIKRVLVISTMQDVQDNFTEYVAQVRDTKNRFFIKSVRKHWSYAGSVEGWYDSGAAMSLDYGNGDAHCLLSPFITIKEDDLPPLYQEYRCFYFFGKLCSISRYCDYGTHKIPEYIRQEALNYETHIIGTHLPETVVIDIADTVDLGPVFLEANDVISSGRYVLNTIESFPLTNETI